MGLDQYLRARTKTVKQKHATGACGGLFPIAPKDRGTTEIGYWRKAYSVSSYLRNVLDIDDDFNLDDKEISYEQVVDILTYAQTIVAEKDFDNKYDEADWLDVVDYFSTAKEILENDPDAQIYYMEWY